MANLDFFAVRDDFAAIFDHLFTNTDVQIFEAYSEYDQELRRFRSTEELLAALPIGLDRCGNGFANFLAVWSPSVMPEPEIKRIDFSRKIDGYTHRFCVEGRGLMHLHLGGIFENTMTKSNFGHFSEKGAARWGPVDEINWPASRKLSNKILYLIGKKLQAARVPGMPVLKGALEMHEQGYLFKVGRQVYELIQDAGPVVQENALVRYNQPL